MNALSSENILGLLQDVKQQDLNQLSQQELESIMQQCNQLTTDINASLALKKSEEISNALAMINSIANQHGIPIDNLSGLISKDLRKTKSDVKYRNTENPNETWTGLGRKPKWLHEAIAAGAELDNFKI